MSVLPGQLLNSTDILVVPVGPAQVAFRITDSFRKTISNGSGTGQPGPPGKQGQPGPRGFQGAPGTPGGFVGDIDGGNATTVYGGIDPIDGGTA